MEVKPDPLVQFIESRDEAAFAELVRLHGPMVLGVCRRALGNPHDAEDAFQATFVVLARRAASIGRRDLLANWLYGVACRCAMKLRGAVDRRRQVEGETAEMREANCNQVSVAEDFDRRELITLLDKEILALPEKLRAAVVLCDLEGRSRQEAAELLRIPEGTLSSRLAAARNRLAARMARRGAVTGVMITAWLGTRVTVSEALATATVQTGMAAATGAIGAATVAAISTTKIVSLAEGVMRTMVLMKLKVMAAIAVTAIAIPATGGVAWHVAHGAWQGATAAENTAAEPAESSPSAARLADAPDHREAPAAVPAEAVDVTLYHIGNSHTWDFDPSNGFREMGKTQRVAIKNGWHIYGGHNLTNMMSEPTNANGGPLENKYGLWQGALKDHAWDVITLQAFAGAQTAKEEEQAAVKFIQYALANNKGSKPPRFYLYTTWCSFVSPATFDYSDLWMAPFHGPDKPFTHSRGFNSWLTSEIAKEGLKAQVHVIPTGEVFYEFDQAAKAGRIPGFTGAEELYRDKYIHMAGIGQYMASLTVYAKVFGIDARLIGLPDHVKWAYNGYQDPRLNPSTCLIIANLVNKVLARGSTVPVSGVSVSPASATLVTNETAALTATVTPCSADQDVTWTTSNTAVATVSSSGLVTGKGIGTATITASSVDPTKTATCAVTVNATGVFTNYFNELYTGTRNDFHGSLGYQFTPTENITVTALGRPVSTSMKQDHAIKIWKESDKTFVAAVTVKPSSPVDGLGYKYEMLSTPVTLTSGTVYRITSDEHLWGDKWSDGAKFTKHSNIAKISNAVWSEYSWPGYPVNCNGPGADFGYIAPTFYTIRGKN